MKELGNRWRLFLNIVLDPWVLVLLFATSGFLIASLYATSKVTLGLLSVLITLSSAVLGGRVMKYWSDLTEQNIITARGTTAVRSLKLLLRNIGSLESRLSIFLHHLDEESEATRIAKRNYEEAISACIVLEEEVVSSIENWTDIIPEADIKTQIGLISELKRKMKERAAELRKLKSEHEDTRGKTEEDKELLQEQIREKTAQIVSLEDELNSKKLQFSISDTPLGSGYVYPPVVGEGLRFVVPVG
ncbi:MAG: hypothetical protein IID38_06115, partial [Planctomycetes bacterium]|nr:hypothetical protein [Planctomycetota bacterium]